VPLGIRIVDARERSLAEINELIARSKAHWKWPEGYLEKSLPLHTISSAYLRSNHCFEGLDAHDKLIAFVSVVVSDARTVLDNLWVAPELLGKGIGRRACEWVFQLARERGWTELWVFPDPPAEGFYEKLGFSDTGEQVPSRVSGGPVFSTYRIRLSTESESAAERTQFELSAPVIAEAGRVVSRIAHRTCQGGRCRRRQSRRGR
jgi:GNAT superfamily N-acetyltransferase